MSLYTDGLLYSAAKEELAEAIFNFSHPWLSPQAKQQGQSHCIVMMSV